MNELEDFASHYHETPVFERKEPVERGPEGSTKQSLPNETKDHNLNIGLSDRNAFLNHLFDNDQENFRRVLSQINSMHSFKEAKAFIIDKVKPEYNNWKNKEEIEKQFITLVEKRFS